MLKQYTIPTKCKISGVSQMLKPNPIFIQKKLILKYDLSGITSPGIQLIITLTTAICMAVQKNSQKFQITRPAFKPKNMIYKFFISLYV